MFGTATQNKIEEAMGMSMAALMDEQIMVKIQRKAELERPPEFEMVTPFTTTGKRDKKLNGLCSSFSEEFFEYQKATAETNWFDPEENTRKSNEVCVVRATDRETRVRVEFELDNDQEVHLLMIENENQEKPAGGFNVKKNIEKMEGTSP